MTPQARSRFEAAAARYRPSGLWRDETLVQHARARLEQDAERVGIVDGERHLTFSELWDDALSLRSWLTGAGLVRGDVVSYQLPNWHEAVLINLACAMGGFVVNPLVPIYRDREVGYMLADSRSRVLFVPGRFRSFDYPEMARRLLPTCPDLAAVVVIRAERSSEFIPFGTCLSDKASGLPKPPEPDDVKLILYTSGTTGRPKAVLHTHNTIMAEIAGIGEYWGVTPGDVVFMASPVSHITGYLYALEQPFVLRSSAVLLDTWNAKDAARLIRRHGCTITFGATPFLKELVDEVESSGKPVPTLRLFPCGGAPVPSALIYRAAHVLRTCRVYRIYGASEVAGAVALGARDGDLRLAAETDGELWHCEAKIVDPRGREVPSGAEGEILLRGPQTCIGYGDPADDEAAFDPDGFFRTGDLGKIDPPGFVVTTGRAKDLIIRGGENLSPREIEDLLVQHPVIREAAVVGIPEERLGEAVCAFVTCLPGAGIDQPEAARFLADQKLAKQKIPVRIEVLDELPKTASGKVRKDILREKAAALDG